MISRIKYYLLLGCFPILLQAQVIDQIKVVNNVSFSDDEIISWAEIGKGTLIYEGILDSINSRVAYNLNLRGFFNPEFSQPSMEFSSDSQKVNILLPLIEGDATQIKKIFLTGNDSLLQQKSLQEFNYLEGQVFNKYEIDKSINDILLNLENEGYPFSAIIITSVHFYFDSVEGNNYADLYLKLESGIKSCIDKVEVRGNDSTQDDVVIRELRIEKGEKYSQERIDEFPKRLNRLRFFEPVAKPQFYIDSENNGVLVIDLKERQTNNFDGIIGYQPALSEEETGFVTGLVHVSLRNLFGTGRAAAFRWRKINRNSQELEVKYLEPWLFNFPLNVNLLFYQRQQDTLYVKRTYSAEIEYLATDEVSAGVFITTESTIPTLTEPPVFTVFNSSNITTGVNFKFDTRDDPLSPTGGIFFFNSYKLSKKSISGPNEFITESTEKDLTLQRFEATLALYYEMFRKQVLALSISGKELRGSSFEISDLFRLGGTNSLRGYREDQFLGNRIFWTNFEYRFFLTPRTYAFLFFDTGYFLRSANELQGLQKLEDFKTGYGLGLNLETAIGILGVSFALAEGDSFSDGKIHFGIVNEF